MCRQSNKVIGKQMLYIMILYALRVKINLTSFPLKIDPIFFQLIPSTIKRIICKKRLVLEFQDGLMIQFNPNTELVDKVSNFFDDWKNNSTSPKSKYLHVLESL